MVEKIKTATTSKTELTLIVIMLILFPLIYWKSNYIMSIGYIALIYMMVISGLDILLGYTGMLNMGQAAFYAIGAYTSALISMNSNIPVIFCMFIGAALSMLIGYLLAFGASRLVRHFLVISTTAFSQIVYILICNWKNVTNSFLGLKNIPRITIFGYVIKSNLQIYILFAAFLLIALIAKTRIVSSRTGRAMMSVRDNPVAAVGVGVNSNHYKRLAFALCAAYGGFSGAMYAHAVRFISPESFALTISVTFLTMVFLGGRGSLLGPVIGAIVISVTQTALQSLGRWQSVIFGIFLLVVVMYYPAGLYGLFQEIIHKIFKHIHSGKKEILDVEVK